MVIDNYIKVPMIVNFGSDLVVQKLTQCKDKQKNKASIDTTRFIEKIYNEVLESKMKLLHIPHKNIFVNKVSSSLT